MEESMSAADVPAGTLQFSSSMPSIDDLLHQYKARSVWKIVSMPNLTALCHKHKCDKCSTYLEHLLISAHVGELCAHPDGLKARLDHVWPAAVNDIHRDVSKPPTDKINRNQQEISDLHDRLAKEHHLQRRIKEWLAQYNGKQKEESEVTMDSPLLSKRQAAGHPPPPTLLAVYMPAEIPVEVDIPPPQKSKDSHGAHVLHDPMEDMFNWEYTSKSSTHNTPDPLKRRLKKKKSQGGLANHLGPHPMEPQDVDMSPVVTQGTNTHTVEKHGATTHCIA